VGERADDLQAGGAQPASDQVDGEGLGVVPLADIEAGFLHLQALVFAGRVAGPGDVPGQAGEITRQRLAAFAKKLVSDLFPAGRLK
jgi:hypothetical protein